MGGKAIEEDLKVEVFSRYLWVGVYTTVKAACVESQ